MSPTPSKSSEEDATEANCRCSVGEAFVEASQSPTAGALLQVIPPHLPVDEHHVLLEFRTETVGIPVEPVLQSSFPVTLHAQTSQNEVCSQVPGPGLAPSGESETSRKTRVLVMDDEEPIRVLVETMLSMLDYEVVAVASGREAVAAHAEAFETGCAFDIAIMDLMIPDGLGGKEAIKWIRQKDTVLKAVVSSGHSSDPVILRHKDFGFDAVLPKPYLMKDIKRVLDQLNSQ